MSDEKTCRLIVDEIIKRHVEEYHTKKRDITWLDVVLPVDKKEFLRQERSYCQGAEHKFRTLPEGNEKEEIRKIILTKRKEFLEIWRKTRTCVPGYGYNDVEL